MSTVSLLCVKAQKNPKFLEELQSRRDSVQARQKAIADVVIEMDQYNVFIDSSKAVRYALNESTGIDAKEHEIKMVMREDLGMRYRKIVPISVHGNSEKNLVLRQQFALKLIQLMQ